MPCHHVYHESCLFQWLDQSNKCPLCRYELETDNEDYNRGVHERNRKFEEAMPPTQCDAADIGCCWHQEDKANDDMDPYVRLDCKHAFHRQCIEGAARIDAPDDNPLTSVKCLRCRKTSKYIQDSKQ